MTNLPIAIPMEDEIIHTDAHPICADPSCPCKAKLRVGSKVLIEVEVRGFFQDSMMVAGGWMPLTRVLDIVDERREAAQRRNATTQCSDGSWW